jgi:ADP-ribosylglycohydrolase
MTGGGPFTLEPGQWTDDTSMAMCLAQSLVDQNGFDATDQVARYVRWYRDGYWSSTGRCFDIGGTTQAALSCFERTGEPFSGGKGERSAGNGSIMRLSPVPLFFSQDRCNAIYLSGQSSRTTHGLDVCIDACRYLGALIIGAAYGAEKETILSDHYAPVDKYWTMEPLHTDIAEIASGSFKQCSPPDIRGSGHVVKSLEAALWAFDNSTSFEEGCLLAVNLGDDADTTAAVYGQLAGAYYGEGGIPEHWRTKIALRDQITSLADRLWSAAITENRKTEV